MKTDTKENAVYWGDKDNLTDEEAARRGRMLADILNLKKEKGFAPVRYKTEWGSKTELGLFLTVQRIIEDGY